MGCSWTIVSYSPARPNITASQLAIANIAGDFAFSHLMLVYLGKVVYMFVKKQTAMQICSKLWNVAGLSQAIC